MPEQKSTQITRDQLAELLNEDLSREYQAIIAYVVYSQVLKGAQYMDIASQLEIHAKQELDHALTLSRQIDYLGKMPVVTPKPVRTSQIEFDYRGRPAIGAVTLIDPHNWEKRPGVFPQVHVHLCESAQSQRKAPPWRS